MKPSLARKDSPRRSSGGSKIQAGQSSAQRQSAQKSQHRTGARNEVEQEHGQPDGQRKQQFF